MSFVEMSFSATVLILIIMLLRKFLLDRLPKRAFLILWGIALLRLLVPVSVPSSFSIYSLIQRWDDGRENMTGSSRTISSEWNTELLSGTAAVQNHSGMQMAKIQETESGQMHRSPDLVLPPDQCLGGYCIACPIQKILCAIWFPRRF